MLTLSETHLNEHSSLLWHIQSYTFVYNKNSLSGTPGGVAVFISNEIQWLRRIDLEHLDLEFIWIEVFVENAKFMDLRWDRNFSPKVFPCFLRRYFM